jgi:hypothetical protein
MEIMNILLLVHVLDTLSKDSIFVEHSLKSLSFQRMYIYIHIWKEQELAGEEVKRDSNGEEAKSQGGDDGQGSASK